MIRKGEMTTSQIGAFIIGIVSFLAVLGFLYLAFGPQNKNLADYEACRLSVLTRATTFDALQSSVPLKCTTEKICFTNGYLGKCRQFAGEDGVRRVKLPGDAVAAARIVEEESAKAMYDCWSMMGEGKLDLFAKASEFLIGSGGEATCVVCSRLALAEDVQEDEEYYNKLRDEINLNNYLRDNNVPGQSLTYLNAFAKDPSFNSYADAEKYNLAEIDGKEVRRDSDDQIAFVFSQVKAKTPAEVLSNSGIAAASAFFVLPGKSSVIGALYLGPQAIVTVPATIIAGGVAVGGIALNAYNGRTAAAGYCGDFVSNADEDKLRAGCSLVRAVNYNVQDVNTLCPSSIQGNP